LEIIRRQLDENTRVFIDILFKIKLNIKNGGHPVANIVVNSIIVSPIETTVYLLTLTYIFYKVPTNLYLQHCSFVVVVNPYVDNRCSEESEVVFLVIY
jgi:hypothetical protein